MSIVGTEYFPTLIECFEKYVKGDFFEVNSNEEKKRVCYFCLKIIEKEHIKFKINTTNLRFHEKCLSFLVN